MTSLWPPVEIQDMRSLGLMLAGAMALLIVYSLANALSSRAFLPGGRVRRVSAPVAKQAPPAPAPGLPRPAACAVRTGGLGGEREKSRVTEAARWAGLVRAELSRIDDWAALARVRVTRDPDLRLGRAHSLFAARRFVEAAAAYKGVLDVSPKNVDAWMGLAQSLGADGGYEAAADAYEAALRIAPEHVAGRFNLGVTRVRLGHVGAAEEAFRRVLEIDPAHKKALYNLATLAQAEGKLGEARRLWTRVAGLGGLGKHEALLHVGRLALAQGDPSGAAEALDLAVLERPAATEGVNALAEALQALEREQGEVDDADRSPVAWWLWSLAVDCYQPAVAARLRDASAGGH